MKVLSLLVSLYTYQLLIEYTSADYWSDRYSQPAQKPLTTRKRPIKTSTTTTTPAPRPPVTTTRRIITTTTTTTTPRPPPTTLSTTTTRQVIASVYTEWSMWTNCNPQGFQTRRRSCRISNQCADPIIRLKTGQGRVCKLPVTSWAYTKTCQWICDEGANSRSCVMYIKSYWNPKGYDVFPCASCTVENQPVGRCWRLDIIYSKTRNNGLAMSSCREEWGPRKDWSCSSHK